LLAAGLDCGPVKQSRPKPVVWACTLKAPERPRRGRWARRGISQPVLDLTSQGGRTGVVGRPSTALSVRVHQQWSWWRLGCSERGHRTVLLANSLRASRKSPRVWARLAANRPQDDRQLSLLEVTLGAAPPGGGHARSASGRGWSHLDISDFAVDSPSGWRQSAAKAGSPTYSGPSVVWNVNVRNETLRMFHDELIRRRRACPPQVTLYGAGVSGPPT
jgi:hypothetical protein